MARLVFTPKGQTSDKMKILRMERWKRKFRRLIAFIALAEAFAIVSILKYYGAI